jgi:DNA-binding XRE family transcriptional regulator
LNNKKTGILLAQLRGTRNQNDVAKELGISVSALSMYENGERTPRDEIKIKIAKLYGRSIEEIFFNSNVHDTCIDPVNIGAN